MRWLAVPVIAVLMGNPGLAQVNGPGPGVGTGISVPVLPVAPIPYGFSNSVIDHNGNVLIFDVTYEIPVIMPPLPIPFRFPPKAKTHVTVIASNATSKSDAQYDGAFQVAGVGRHAVYAVINDYAASTTAGQPPISVTRRLVALSQVFPTLPSLDVPLQADVKVSAVGDDNASDTITFVDNIRSPIILGATDSSAVSPSIPVQQRTVQMFQFDGTSFKALTPTPISLP